MNYKVEKQLVDDAIHNCRRIDYSVIVTGGDYGDDLAHALSVINSLLDKVDQLERFINNQDK